MRILSLNGGHDASLCVYCDGKIEYFILSERFTKIKHDEDFNILKKIFKSTFNTKVDFISTTKSHHLNHASISFYNSGFDQALVLVVDAMGSRLESTNLYECESLYIASYPDKFDKIYANYVRAYETLNIEDMEGYLNVEDNTLKKYKTIFPNCEFNCKSRFGIGYLYDTAYFVDGINYVDKFGVSTAGKIMGLSSYGKKSPLNLNFFRDDMITVDDRNFTHRVINPPNNSFDYMVEGINLLEIPEKITKENYKNYADYCYELQVQTQEAMCTLIQKGIDKTGIKNVCISGGYGMNIVANHYYLQKFPEVNFYFEPMCNDSGQSIGSAMLEYRRRSKDMTIYHNQTTSFHGFMYDVKKYKGITTPISKIAKLLSENKSVAVYSGLAEAGQRALGNRSIFFNALNPNAKDIVNKIKNREWYRPFAAAVLLEDARTYFNMGRITESPFMTISFPVNEQCINIIPGVVHVDNTCRIQTVSQSNGYLYELLLEVKKLTGHGILLNTSFNLAGDPLVETPKDAFATLNNSCLNYLWFEETEQLFGDGIDNPSNLC
jgi:carbamoyltransferase